MTLGDFFNTERGIIITNVEAVVSMSNDVRKSTWFCREISSYIMAIIIIHNNHIKGIQNKTFVMSPGKINLYLIVKRLSDSVSRY